ncbi:MAG: hypothetical protein JXA03_03740 [Bacteroidales bacterium]|nr:hypothetical protein [Bacteroidales bacterium]
MDDFLYLLLIIAWLAFTLYNRSQKKKAGKSGTVPAQGQVKKEPSILEALLGGSLTMADDEKDTEYQIQEEGEAGFVPSRPQSAYAGLAGEKLYQQSSRKPFLSNELDLFMGEGAVESISDSEIGNPEDEQGRPVYSIDLKKAVVYAEILNPPYI